jgi:transcriptional regulator with XRE-family HTH domain
MRRTAFETWFEQWLRDIFDSADEVWNYSIAELAAHAKLSVSVVYRYKNREVTEPRLRTVRKLCHAVGMDIEIVKEEMAAALAKTGNRRRRRAA